MLHRQFLFSPCRIFRLCDKITEKKGISAYNIAIKENKRRHPNMYNEKLTVAFSNLVSNGYQSAFFEECLKDAGS